MKTINVVNGPQNVSAIVQGCMRMAPLSIDEATKVIRNAYDLGVTFFDHATCYTNGECEQRFGDAFPKTDKAEGKTNDSTIPYRCRQRRHYGLQPI